MNQSRSTGGGTEDMRLERMHMCLRKVLNCGITGHVPQRQDNCIPLLISKLVQITQQTNVRHLLPDADHAARNSLS